ncbi:MAG: acyl-CoA dehydrogenase family protein [Myxococcota bacterium]
MAIDFSLPPEIVELRDRVREFIEKEITPVEAECRESGRWREGIRSLRERARTLGLWCPQLPPEFGGMGLGPLGMATVSAECGRAGGIAAFILNCQAPDEGNMHTLLHFGTPEQKERYLRPLADGRIRSCFAMTEPEVAGSDPTGIQTRAELHGESWVLNGHKWFISGARGASFAIVIACTDPDARPRQARNSAFLVDLPCDGFEIVRDIETMAGRHNHCEIRLSDVVVPAENLLGPRGQGHTLGQVRLGPARLAHCMRWIGSIEMALDLLVKRAEERELHGARLSEKQGIQWMISECALELYQCKLMVLHSAYLIETGRPFRQEVSMTKHHVANTLWRVVDRAIQVHGALGYSTDTPLEQMLRNARSARLVDGADEVHLTQIAKHVLDAWRSEGTTRRATGLDLLF